MIFPHLSIYTSTDLFYNINLPPHSSTNPFQTLFLSTNTTPLLFKLIIVSCHLKSLQQMFQSHINTLSFAAIAARIHKAHYSKEKEERLVLVLVKSALNEYALNYLYHLVRLKASQPQEQMELLYRTEFIIKVSQWIINQRTHANGLEKALSPRSQLQIIELIGIIISSAQDVPEHADQIYSTCQEILTHFYELVERSERPELRGRYLDCIAKMFRVNPNIFNINIYAEMLSVTEDKVDEFYQFLDYYLLQRNGHDEATIGFILEGFAKRMKMFSEMNMIIRIERRGILKAYAKLIAFLRSHLGTTFPERVLSEYPCIYEYLLSFVNREFDQQDLCKVLNNLVEVYMQSSINNLTKFKFVLTLFKEILSRAASLFSLLSTAPLTGDHDFLNWFVGRELCQEKEEEALQTYFKNQHSLQFLLVLAIFSCVQLPQRTEQVSRFMRSINLPSESQEFLFSEDVKDYLQAFYSQTGDMESLEDLPLRIELARR